MISLKTCPCCGGEAAMYEIHSYAHFVYCKVCKTASNAFEKAEEAATAWNKRTDTRHIGRIKDASIELDEIFEEFD